MIKLNVQEESQAFSQYTKLCQGNEFKAAMLVAHLADELRSRYNGTLSSSEAITWVLTSKPPESFVRAYATRKHLQNISSQKAIDYLSYIDDPKIKQAVFDSLRKSVSEGNTSYEYSDITDEWSKSRIRVITNMIFDQIEQATSEDSIV